MVEQSIVLPEDLKQRKSLGGKIAINDAYENNYNIFYDQVNSCL